MYYTNSQRDDGFGAIFQNIIFDILSTEYHGNTFIYTPIKSIDHNYNTDPNFTNNLEKFMNIKDYYIYPENVDVNNINTIKCVNSYPFVQANMDQLFSSESFKKLKDIFYMNKQSPFDDNYIHISVHIRRPNSRDVRVDGSDTPDSYYIDKINLIKNSFSDKPLKFHIYSQGDEANFKSFISDNTIFHLNESVESTFLGLVYANILITSRSSFSYTAGLLSNGTIIYQKFWHPPLNSWIISST